MCVASITALTPHTGPPSFHAGLSVHRTSVFRAHLCGSFEHQGSGECGPLLVLTYHPPTYSPPLTLVPPTHIRTPPTHISAPPTHTHTLVPLPHTSAQGSSVSHMVIGIIVTALQIINVSTLLHPI